MKLTINGKQKQLDQDTLLSEIIQHLCRNSQHVVAEVNGEIIKRKNWSDRVLIEGDSIELVTMVGGG